MVNEELPGGPTVAVRQLVWAPTWVKWNPEANYEISWGMNILFGLVSDVLASWSRC